MNQFKEMSEIAHLHGQYQIGYCVYFDCVVIGKDEYGNDTNNYSIVTWVWNVDEWVLEDYDRMDSNLDEFGHLLDRDELPRFPYHWDEIEKDIEDKRHMIDDY